MPRSSGEEFIRWLRTVGPSLAVLVITGHYSEEILRKAVKVAVSTIMKKPVRLRELSDFLAWSDKLTHL